MANNNDPESDAGPSTATRKPRDGPAAVFEADPLIPDIFTGEDGDYFGLVLVTNWPVSPLEVMDDPYRRFLAAVRSCFRDEDVSPSDAHPASLPAVYLYPTEHLHVTLASFHRPTKVADSPELSGDAQRAKKRKALELVRSASKLPGWPKEPLRLVVDSARIGTRAGILLWKDLSGGVDAIRSCLREALLLTDAGGSDGAKPMDASIPGIIHSTFLRFAEVPRTPAKDVQDAFESRGLGTPGGEFFRASGSDGDETATTNSPLILRADTVRLVSESVPYMHLPNDDEHVPWSTELAE
mmetsp:Transcript_27715/g.65101  ORF Transcript_27715/g.65101 Transcript_27715/m.65101 type:complete len:297 (-) Transcript_27715:1905-2795(-)